MKNAVILCIFDFPSNNSLWRFSAVTPVFKKGDASDLNNYRPISLTAVCCRVLESLIEDKIIQHLDHFSLLSPSQHGFLRRHSTQTNLLETLNDWNGASELIMTCLFE